ncbi:MAG: leucine-rich repeat domain-containing protein [Prevotella sp.]|nr:leucine-rich repeat domain-containing protein [Prevotella sp.]
MKRLLSLTALLLLAVASFAHDFEVDGIYYVIISSSSNSPTVSVSYKGTSYNSYSNEYTGSVTIPETVTYSGVTYSVTSIDSYAFYKCSGLTSVNIPESLTNIGGQAFRGCSGLTSVTIPESVTSIGEMAFYDCSILTSIILESNAILSYKYYTESSNLRRVFGDQVKKITIGNGVESIGGYAFYDMRRLASIDIPNSVTSIGSKAFDSVYDSKISPFTVSVTLPDNITFISSSAFPTSRTTFRVNNHASKTLISLWGNGYVKVSDIESGSYISTPRLSASSTQTTMQVKLVDKYPGLTYTYNGNKLKSEEDEIIYSGSGLMPEEKKYFNVKVALDENSYFFISQSISTSYISPTIESSTSASSLNAKGSYIKGDAEVTKTVIKCNGKTVEGDEISLNGLTPNTSYNVEYVVTVKGNKTYNNSKTIKTEPLTLKTEQPKVVSAGNVVVAAETNVDENEKDVGFEWRRTDWTSDFASNSGSAVVYGNTMEGYIRNMNTDKLWKYRAYYLSDDGTYYYGDWVGLDPSNTSYFEPTVHTYADISTTGKVALIRGYVLNGTDKVTVQGFKYWKTANKSNSLDIAMEAKPQAAVVSVPADAITQTVAIVGAGQQLMNATLENLDYGSTYQCVAFATTSENETFYGEVQTFTTEAGPTGIEGVKEDARSSKPVTVVACYDINGKQLSAPQKGLNIIKMSDGTTRKVVR